MCVPIYCSKAVTQGIIQISYQLSLYKITHLKFIGLVVSFPIPFRGVFGFGRDRNEGIPNSNQM